MRKKINAALTSFGMSGEYFHATFLDANPDFSMVKVLERHSERSKKIYPYVNVVKDFKNILSDSDIDLVVINTPNYLHYEMGKKALAAGKHVIIEKPFTPTVKEAKELINLANKKNRLLSVYQNRRWDGDFLTVKKIIENKLLGELVEFRSHFDRYRNFIKPNSWKEEEKPGSGLLYDIGSHLIDQAVCLFGKPLSVFADLRTQRKKSKIIDNFEIILNYSKLKVILNSGFLYKQPLVRFVLSGAKGTFIKNGLDPQEDTLKTSGFKNSITWGNEPEEQWGIMNAEINGLDFKGKIKTEPGKYYRYYENVYEAVTNRKKLDVKPEQVLVTSRIIELALKSNKEKKVIEYIDY
jgi:scyllo-inositol 2-dehydrogenase (NADP+)